MREQLFKGTLGGTEKVMNNCSSVFNCGPPSRRLGSPCTSRGALALVKDGTQEFIVVAGEAFFGYGPFPNIFPYFLA